MSRLRRALAVLGGPNAVTWPGFWVALVTGIAANLGGNAEIKTSFLARLAVAALPMIVAWSPLLLVRIVLLRGSDPRPRPGLILAAIVLAAAIRAVITDGLHVALGWSAAPALAYRFTAGLILFIVIVPLMAFVVDGARAHSRRISELRELAGQLEQARNTAQTAALDRNEAVVRRIKERLLTEIAQLDAAVPADSLARLQSTASDVVRPLSHELATQVPMWAPEVATEQVRWRLNLRSVFSGSGSARPLLPWVSAVLLLMCILPGSLWFLPGWLKVGVPAVTFLGAGGVLELANRTIGWVKRVLPALRIIATIVLVAASGFAVGAALLLVNSTNPTGLLHNLAIAACFFLPVFAALTGIVKAVSDQRIETEQRLQATTIEMRWQLARVGQVQWVQQRGLSRALHGPVQAAVNAAAIRLDSAMRDGDDTRELVTSLQAELLDVVGQLDSSSFEVAHRLDVHVQRILDTWSGIAAVAIDIDLAAHEALGGDAIAEVCVMELVGESISNAIRHGQAATVSVTVRVDPPFVDLTIRDDGIAVKAERRGLGSQLLDEMAVRWSRQIGADGFTELSAEVPIEQPSTST